MEGNDDYALTVNRSLDVLPVLAVGADSANYGTDWFQIGQIIRYEFLKRFNAKNKRCLNVLMYLVGLGPPTSCGSII